MNSSRLNTALILLGGGIDSAAVMVHMVNHLPVYIRRVALHVDYGQMAAQAELAACQNLCHALGFELITAKTDMIRLLNPHANLLMDGEGSHVVNGRNASLMMIAAAHADHIWFGATDGKMMDTNPTFIGRMQDMLNAHCFEGRTIRIYAPLLGMTKQEAAEYAVKHQTRVILDLTMTCWTPLPDGSECGECKHCVEKARIKAELGDE